MPSGLIGVGGGGGGSGGGGSGGGGCTFRKVASSRSVKQVHGDEIAAGRKSMKRAKRVTDSAESNSVPKRFVGVRQRPSGRWVAEIKDTTQKIRLWLGTFDSAEEGAKAYDSAARALRGANTRTNFVPAIASCDATSKAARLIRLRQQTAAADSKACAKKLEQKLGRGRNQLNTTTSPLLRQDLNGDAHSQVTCTTIPPSSPARLDFTRTKPNAQPESPQSDIAPVAPPQQSAITSENLSNAINRSLTRDAPTDAPQLQCEAADHEDQKLHPLLESFPCGATIRADVSLCAAASSEKEAASSADNNEVMFAGINLLHPTSAIVLQSKEGVTESVIMNPLNSPSDLQYHVDDQLDHRNNINPILRESGSNCFPDYMIPWPDYVLVDGLDSLSCETSTTTTTGVVYPEAFDFSAEAMDRDSLKDQHSFLSDDDSSEFLLKGLQQRSTQSSGFQGPCELPKSSPGGIDQLQSPGSMDSDGAADCDECPDQDQALWISMDLAPLCMVAQG